MNFRVKRIARRLKCLVTHTALAYYIYRYRYLCLFALFGFAAIGAECLLVRFALPREWPWLAKSSVGFFAGLSISFALNAGLNFQVPRQYLWATFLRFAAVSAVS